MKISQTPYFNFSRQGQFIYCWFSPSPLKKDGNIQGLPAFNHECKSEMEAVLLMDYLSDFYRLMKKDFFTEGFNTHKKREKNWML